MGTLQTISALESMASEPINAYVVQRSEWLLVDTPETFLAATEEEALELSYDLKGELLVLIGDHVGVGGCSKRYDALVREAMQTVTVSPVTIRRH